MTDSVAELARAYKALGDENRLTIVTALAGGEKYAGEVLGLMGFSQPTLSHHMKLLIDAGVVQSRRDGQKIYYSLAAEGLRDAAETLKHLVNEAPTAPTAAQRRRLQPVQRVNPVPVPGPLSGSSPAGETPAAEETPAGQTPVVGTSAGEAPAGEAPAGEAPAGEAPAGEAPAAGETSAEKTSTEKTPPSQVESWLL